jgi:hypothetical protein
MKQKQFPILWMISMDVKISGIILNIEWVFKLIEVLFEIIVKYVFIGGVDCLLVKHCLLAITKLDFMNDEEIEKHISE